MAVWLVSAAAVFRASDPGSIPVAAIMIHYVNLSRGIMVHNVTVCEIPELCRSGQAGII
jgi:hypothetical protein